MKECINNHLLYNSQNIKKFAEIDIEEVIIMKYCEMTTSQLNKTIDNISSILINMGYKYFTSTIEKIECMVFFNNELLFSRN